MTSNWTKYFQDSAYFFFIQTICRSRIEAKRQQLKLVVLKKTIHDFAAEFPYLFPPCVSARVLIITGTQVHRTVFEQ